MDKSLEVARNILYWAINNACEDGDNVYELPYVGLLKHYTDKHFPKLEELLYQTRKEALEEAAKFLEENGWNDTIPTRPLGRLGCYETSQAVSKS